MLFLSIALVAIFLYTKDCKVFSLFLFFLLITQGFQLIPEATEITHLAFITKGMDYAFFALLGVVTIDSVFIKDYWRRDQYTKYLVFFGIFLVVCVLYSRFFVGVAWSGIIRVSRYHFFWIAYFIFRNIEKERLEVLLKWLFNITVILSILYIFQIIFDTTILNEGAKAHMTILGIEGIPRFYNQPSTLHFFTFIAIYCNPYQGVKKNITTIILVIALLGAFHRSLIGCFIFALFIGYLVSIPRLKRLKILVRIAFFVFCISIFIGYKLVHSETFIDLNTILSSDFMSLISESDDLSAFIDEESTFTYRILHLYERSRYLLEHPKAMILGVGFITEESRMTDNMFDFNMGLLDLTKGRQAQLNTPDISYSELIMYLGYLGTILNLLLFIRLIIFFYKKRENKYALSSFLFFVCSFGTSFFSANLLQPITFLLPLLTYHIVQKEFRQKSLDY